MHEPRNRVETPVPREDSVPEKSVRNESQIAHALVEVDWYGYVGLAEVIVAPR